MFLCVNLAHWFCLPRSPLPFTDYVDCGQHAVIVVLQQVLSSPLILCGGFSGIYVWRIVGSLNRCIFNLTEFHLPEITLC